MLSRIDANLRLPCPSPAPVPRPDRGLRRNGARSHGPVDAEGKARASRNALTHGLCAMQHLVLEDEVPATSRQLIDRHDRGDRCRRREIEARLGRRLAIAFWKGERAERIEVALFDAAPRTQQERLPVGGGRSAHHLRPQALQRHPRPAGPARPRDQPLPQGAAAAAQGGAGGAHGRTRGDVEKRTHRTRSRPTTTRSRHPAARMTNEPADAAPPEYLDRRRRAAARRLGPAAPASAGRGARAAAGGG